MYQQQIQKICHPNKIVLFWRGKERERQRSLLRLGGLDVVLLPFLQAVASVLISLALIFFSDELSFLHIRLLANLLICPRP